MKTLQLEQMVELQGGATAMEACIVKSMLWGAGWGALFGGPIGMFAGAFGGAAQCLVLGPY